MMDLSIKAASKVPIFQKYEDLLQKIRQDTENLLHIAKSGFTDQVIVDRGLLDDIADILDYVILSAEPTLIEACSIKDMRNNLAKILKKKTDRYF